MSNNETLRSTIIERFPPGSVELAMALELAGIITRDTLCSACLEPAGTVSNAVNAATVLARLLSKLPPADVEVDDALTRHLRAIK